MDSILENISDTLLDTLDASGTDLRGFADEVRDFCRSNLPADIRDKVLATEPLTKDDHLRWHRILAEKSWLFGHWPREYGGLGWTRLQRWIFENEVYRAGSPWLLPFGVTYIGPVLYTFGTEAQKQRFLPPIRNVETFWCQGYSEPGAGSDLAQLRTTATRDGDHYIVSGQKTWTTMAQWADMIFLLVKTGNDPRPQRNISFLMVDLHSPGISIRGIETIDNEHHVNDVFFDGVRVPVENLIGEEGRGWTYAKFLLDNERLLSAEVGKAQRMLGQFDRIVAQAERVTAVSAHRRAIWAERRADLLARTISLESLAFALFDRTDREGDVGPAASMLKILGSELIQAISSATLDVVSLVGLPLPRESDPPLIAGTAGLDAEAAGAVRDYLYHRAVSIFGGSNEIQRNILSKTVLAA